MKTYSGSFWTDVAERIGSLTGSWLIAMWLVAAWWRARNGDLGLFLIDGAVALSLTVVWLHGFRGMLDQVARNALLDERIAILRRENRALETALGSAADR